MKVEHFSPYNTTFSAYKSVHGCCGLIPAEGAYVMQEGYCMVWLATEVKWARRLCVTMVVYELR